MESQVRWVDSSDGVKVALHHFVPPTGSETDQRETLLICHATGFNALTYGPFARRLIDRFDIWALDFRGHGATAAPASGDFVWTGMADDLLACVAEIGGPVKAFGHSMGGAAIVRAECAQSGTITAAYLFEPIILPDEVVIPKGPSSMGSAARRRRPEFESRAAVIERYGSRPPFSTIDPEALQAYVEHGFVDTPDGTVRLACEPESEARTFEGDAKPKVGEIAAIGIPLMFGAGELVGPMSPAHFSVAAAKGVAGSVLKEYPGMYHFGPLEDPDRIAVDAISFLTG